MKNLIKITGILVVGYCLHRALRSHTSLQTNTSSQLIKHRLNAKWALESTWFELN